MAKINILLVDDHSVVRMGFKMLIENESDMAVICEAESGEQGITSFKEHKPNVVIMDITMQIHTFIMHHPKLFIKSFIHHILTTWTK